MSESAADNDEAKPSKRAGLPPLFGPIEDGRRTWIGVGEIDYELMGYLLSCHLIIEHYMDAFLKAHHPDLEWEDARLTFGQRVALLSSWTIQKPFNPVEEIKHLNSLRNRLGHRVDYRLTDEDMLPFKHFLQRIRDHANARGVAPDPHEPKVADFSPHEVLEMFTSMAAVAFAGAVSGRDSLSGVTK
ncbi:hypothetical protein [Paraburkholderia aspalathi]|uniref:hypothetical protein n=1 Tax=Paraburkholderia aspalathi TaxID=1324617 RepID=UPI0038B9B913